MKTLIILVLSLVMVIALPSKEIKARNVVVPAGRLEGRITHGHNATVEQIPFQVGLSLQSRDSNFYWCGGSLINHYFVLTAAHCTKNIVQVEVLLGATDRTDAEVTHVVTEDNIIIHEDYNSYDHHVNDISLIKIPFTRYSKRIQPVKLPAMSRSYSSYNGDEVLASGWGRIGDSLTDHTDNLQWARLHIIPNMFCARHFSIYSTNICTATIGGVNICNGDSGGPLVLETSKIQIGLTSFGATSCLADVPSVYTRLTSYLGWIKKNIRGSF